MAKVSHAYFYNQAQANYHKSAWENLRNPLLVDGIMDYGTGARMHTCATIGRPVNQHGIVFSAL
jgi:hypothetical protein